MDQPNSGERWLPIIGYEGYYEVSNQGRVRSVPRTVVDKNGVHRNRKGVVLSPGITRGYHVYALCKDGIHQSIRCHREVLRVFVGEPGPGMVACHNNGDPTDNRVENLRWDTQLENMRDKVKHGTNHRETKEYCKSGHPLTPDNVYVARDNGRLCRVCRQRWRDEYNARKKRAKSRESET